MNIVFVTGVFLGRDMDVKAGSCEVLSRHPTYPLPRQFHMSPRGQQSRT